MVYFFPFFCDSKELAISSTKTETATLESSRLDCDFCKLSFHRFAESGYPTQPKNLFCAESRASENIDSVVLYS